MIDSFSQDPVQNAKKAQGVREEKQNTELARKVDGKGKGGQQEWERRHKHGVSVSLEPIIMDN